MQIRNTDGFQAWRVMDAETLLAEPSLAMGMRVGIQFGVLRNPIIIVRSIFWFDLAEEARDSLALCGGHKKKGKR